MSKKMNNISSLGEQQRRLVEILWEKGGATVQEVLDEVNCSSGTSPLAYTTILTLLQTLERTGWVVHEKKPGERAYFYRAAREKGEAVRETFSLLATKLFAGNRTILFQQLLDDEQLTDDDLSELTALIHKCRASKKGDK